MSETRTNSAAVRPEQKAGFDDRVDQCLAMVLHYAEVQEIAEVVKRVHADRTQEKTKCNQGQ